MGATTKPKQPRKQPRERVYLTMSPEDHAEFLAACERVGERPTTFITNAVLARARGHQEVPEAFAVVRRALEDVGVLPGGDSYGPRTCSSTLT